MIPPGLRYRAPALLYAALLFWASSRTRLPVPELGWPLQDKLMHAAAYAVLSLLVYLALTRPRPIRAPHLVSVACCVIYAATDEFHQWFVPGRVPDAGDFAADVLGILAVQLVLWWRARMARTGRRRVD